MGNPVRDGRTIVESAGRPRSRGRGIVFLWVALLAVVGASAAVIWLQQEEIDRQRTGRSAAERDAAGLREEIDTIRSDSSSLASQLEESRKKIEKLDLIQRAKSWPPGLVDTFSAADPAGWPTGDHSSPQLTGKISFAFGEYVWSGSSHIGVVWYTGKSLGTFSNLYAAVEARKAGGPADAYCTLLFRKSDQRYYSFRINDTSYSLWRQEGSGLTALRGWTPSPVIRPRRKNRMSVIAQGSHFILMINDQIVDEVTDSALSSGGVDFGLGLLRADESASFAFDNFEVRGSSG